MIYACGILRKNKIIFLFSYGILRKNAYYIVETLGVERSLFYRKYVLAVFAGVSDGL